MLDRRTCGHSPGCDDREGCHRSGELGRDEEHPRLERRHGKSGEGSQEGDAGPGLEGIMVVSEDGAYGGVIAAFGAYTTMLLG